MTIGVAIVGCGLIGTKRAQSLGALGEVVAVHDAVPERSKALGARLGGRTHVDDAFESVLDRDEVELVVVTTTHDALAPIAKAAIEAGKHVLVEKPGALDLAQLLDLRVTAASTDRIVRIGYNHRFHPGPIAARTLLSGRPTEALLYIRGRYGHGGRLGYEREWRADRGRSGGGELIDQGSHLIDLVRFLVGDVSLAFAELTTGFWPIDVEDNAFLALRPARGGLAWLHASWTEWKNLFSLEVALSGCKIELSGLGGSYGPETLTVHEMTEELGPPPSRSWTWPPGDASWHLEVADLVAQLEGREYIGATLEDAIAAMTVIDQAYRS